MYIVFISLFDLTWHYRYRYRYRNRDSDSFIK